MPESHRLPAPWGTRLDRSRRHAFTFDGGSTEGFAGDTVASALLAQGRWVLSRSFKYHRPRGPLTMAGQDANTLVQIGAEPNVRADRRLLADGLKVSAQNASHGADRDLYSVMDRLGRFMPVGFYYRSFFAPGRDSWRNWWEPIISRVAGLGRVDTAQSAPVYRKRSLHCDVLVVGAGSAGMAAARIASAAGAQVVLVDSEPETGGALTWGRYPAGRLAQARAGLDDSNITVLTGATANGWFTDNFVPVIQGDLLLRLRAGQVIIASGTQEQMLVFRNNDLPGIATSAAMQRMLRHYAIRPGRRAAVFAATPHGAQAALDLSDAGIDVAAVLVPPGTALPPVLMGELRAAGLKVLTGATILSAWGKRRLSALEVQTDAGRQMLPCDLATIDAGATPGYQLPLHAGAKLGFDDARGTFTLTGLPEGMHLAGSVAGVFEPDAVRRSGEIAGAQAARALGLAIEVPTPLTDRETDLHRTCPVPDPHPKGRDFVDFDEDLQVKDIVNAVADGYSELELLKRYSTVGMGPSQGRHAALPVAHILARATGRDVAQIGITTARPPFGPEKLGLLAGPIRSHVRLTPLDAQHRAAGAQMAPAGAWQRPMVYGEGDLSGITAREVLRVRQDVGMLDVSTLGKIALRGPDAAAFLDRFCTLAHLNQPVGRVRYCMVLNEMGSVMDDGVAFRMAENDFYMTATTGAVDRVYAEMLRWNAQWRMAVDLQNITPAFAAINVAGPNARKAIERLSGDVALDSAAFPYLHGRNGILAGCPVRIMRIGFTGELSFELHTPRSAAPRLWAELVRAGVLPYGLEASRIMRLEKGHVIIGQDTDALSTPDELGMGWAVSGRKPRFLGKAALDARRAAGLRRILCRFELPAGMAGSVGESCLVMHEGCSVGHVTSVAVSPTLERLIGLAYADPQAAETGRINLRSRSGESVQAPLAQLPFYDPENLRQEL